MNLLDVLIVLALLASIIRGMQVGFVRQFFSTVGFFVGLFLGAWIESKLGGLGNSPSERALIALGVTLGTALSLSTVGEYGGWRVKFKLSEARVVDRLDRIFGSALAAITLLLAVWLGAAIFRQLPTGLLQRQVRGSRVVSVLNASLPSSPDILTKLGNLIDPNGFPQVFAGLEPAPKSHAPLPDMGVLNAAVRADQASIVKIEGRGCGGIVEGTGFIVAPNEVVTNAHVIAGVSEPLVADTMGTHETRVVSFDPDLDLAILTTSGLTAKPLTLNAAPNPSGTPAAVVGYPGGGAFTAVPAAVLDNFIARGRNIYNKGETERRVYSIKADVEEGNSGGPLIIQNGDVIGVVFAKSTSYNGVGYALDMQKVIDEINQVKGSTTAVKTGSCAE